MRKSLALVPVLAFALAGCSSEPDTPEAKMAHERHENFEKIGDAMKAIGDEVKKSAPDVALIQASAATINGFAPKVETWFPKGSGPQDGVKTDALETVWTKPDEFKKAAAKFVDEAAKFDALAKAGDVAAIGAGMKALGGSCKGCHDQFREKD